MGKPAASAGDSPNIASAARLICSTRPSPSTTMLSALQERELWYHGNVPPVRDGDNHWRHIIVHSEELKSERFQKLEAHSPETAGLVRAHIADHMTKVAFLQEQQEQGMMVMAQQQAMMNLNPGAPGAPLPSEGAESPKFRQNEVERGEGEGESDGGDGEGTTPRADAGRNAPNMGSIS